MAAETPDINAKDASGQTVPGGPQTTPEAPGAAPLAAPPPGSGLGKRSTARKGAKLPISTVNFLMIGLYGAGILGVYLLSLRAGVEVASAEEQATTAKVEALLDMDQAMSAQPKPDETAAVVDTFYYDAKQRQIPVRLLVGNPFLYVPPGTGLTSKELNKLTTSQVREREKRNAMMAAVRDLQLQSVLSRGERAMAIISGNLVAEGQTINGWTVKSIQSKEVILKWRDEEFVLKMPR